MTTQAPFSPDLLAEQKAQIGVRLSSLRAQIEAACQASLRDPSTVRLVAVSKHQPVQAVAAALSCGISNFGENYAQELRDKSQQIADHVHASHLISPATWHFIGPLQRNKVHLVVGRAALIHSVDNSALVSALSAQVDKHRSRLAEPTFVQRCLVQVNLGQEAHKSGCQPADLPSILREISNTNGRLECVGLMCIPPSPPPNEPDAVTHSRPYFRALSELLHAQPPLPHITLRELSMGMSQDFAAAVAEGATLIRVGTALFGPR